MEIATPRSKYDTPAAGDAGPGVLRAHAPLVLLVGNHEATISRWTERLAGARLRVATARTGFEAIVKACWHVPDVIAFQDGLTAEEGVDGSVAAQLLRICPATSHIPIVACPLDGADLLARIEQELPA